MYMETFAMEFLLACTHERNCMITLCIRYTLNPKKLTDFKTYVMPSWAQSVGAADHAWLLLAYSFRRTE